MKKIILISVLIFFTIMGKGVFAYNNISGYNFMTINNLNSYNLVTKYWSNGTSDFIYQYIKRILLAQVKKDPNIKSFKDCQKEKNIHFKIEKMLKVRHYPQKISSILLYLDDLLYNHVNNIYGNLLNNNTINDQINNKLLREYMCSNEYTKTVIDYGCGTTKPNNKTYKRALVDSQYYKNEGYKIVSKYDINNALYLLGKEIPFNEFKNWIYKSVYLLSPGGWIYSFLITPNGYNNNIRHLLWKRSAIGINTDNKWEDIATRLLSILKTNNYTPSGYTRFKDVINYLTK